MNMEKGQVQKKVLRILSEQYPTQRQAVTEIVNLQSIMCLPKGTEHFLSDIHGEYEQFQHVLKNGSGSVRRKIEEVLGNSLSNATKKELATLIYYPKEKMELIRERESDMDDWYAITIHRLVQLLKSVSSKYTRSKVRKAIPEGYVYVVEELITEKAEVQNKEAYYNAIIHTIIRVGDAENIIEVLCQLVQRLVIDHLHIVGDIFDRGPGPHIIMETLCEYHSVDLQWGNHDIVWMGAGAGHFACIANVIRMAAKYGNLDVIEEGYGINLIPLATFALQTYQGTDLSCFAVPKEKGDQTLNSLMYKAITMIQFKVEGHLVHAFPEFAMEDRDLLSKIDFAHKTVLLQGEAYPILDWDFPTVDPKNPLQLTPEEQAVMDSLQNAFRSSEKLQKHITFLYEKGGLYKIHNENLLFHGCIPLNAEGHFLSQTVGEKAYQGKALYEILDRQARNGFFAKKGSEEWKLGGAYLWYLWNGPKSPVYGRSKMATFERLFVADPISHQEQKNAYYALMDDDKVIGTIFAEFGLNMETGHIINGHVPVEIKNGESPIHCHGKVLLIDGGFSKAYHQTTGISGYTLVENSRGMRLVTHEMFVSMESAIREETDIISDSLEVEMFRERKLVGDTDIGQRLQEQITDLEELLAFYRSGGQ